MFWDDLSDASGEHPAKADRSAMGASLETRAPRSTLAAAGPRPGDPNLPTVARTDRGAPVLASCI